MRFAFLNSCMLVCAVMSTSVKADVMDNYELQWRYIKNFVQYVEWPQNTDINSMTLCVAGHNPFSALPEHIRHHKLTKRLKVHVFSTRLPNEQELSQCHIMYFSAQLDFDKLIYLIEKMKSKPILSISDRGNFVKQGGSIQFFTIKRKLKFYISEGIVDRSELVLSPALLRLSQRPE